MKAEFSLRIATPEDGDNVSELLQASYSVLMARAYEPSTLEAALPIITVANPRLLQSVTYYVAETARGHIVGCGGWTKERPGTGEIQPGLGHIRHFGVHPDWARRGVGRAIYNRCRRDAKDAGLSQLECYSSLNGQAFYAALGFEPRGEIDVELPSGIALPSVRMAAGI